MGSPQNSDPTLCNCSHVARWLYLDDDELACRLCGTRWYPKRLDGKRAWLLPGMTGESYAPNGPRLGKDVEYPCP